MNKLKNENGFVLAEFVIALPLLILLIYTLMNMIFETNEIGKNQAADYILEEEAQEILERITKDARAAKEIKLTKTDNRQNLEIVFHANVNANRNEIIDIHDTRIYILYAKKENFTAEGHEPINHVYVHRQPVTTPTSPITGENFFGDTTVQELEFKIRSEKILHIKLKIKSLKSKRVLAVNTSVFMPACEKVTGF